MNMSRLIEYLFNSFGPNRIVENSEVTSYVDWCGNEERGRCIWVYPDFGRRGLEYFKYYDAYTPYDAKKVARIDFRSPRYIFCKDLDGMSHWWLEHSEKEELMDFLTSKSRWGHNLTNWQAAIYRFNIEKHGIMLNKTKKNLLSDKTLKYPECLPFDLKMPDYRKLPNK